MISKWLFSGAFLFELGSWVTLFTGLPIAEAALLFGMTHCLGSLLLTGGVWILLPQRYKYPLPWSPLFLFSLSFFVPLVGALGVAASVFPALYLPRRRLDPAWRAQGVPQLPFRPLQERRELMFSDGGLQDVLRHARSTDQRMTALFATRRMPAKDSVPILKMALRDPSDDVRLLAYSMLDQQESRINQQIETNLAQLDQVKEAGKGALHGNLARWFWELAYLGLAQGSVLDHVLGQAREHVDQALGLGGAGELYLLAGRIALEQGDLPSAQEYLHHAAEAGIDSAQLNPFRAEIAYFQRRFEAIPGYLAGLPEDQLKRPPFAALARYWL